MPFFVNGPETGKKGVAAGRPSGTLAMKHFDFPMRVVHNLRMLLTRTCSSPAPRK
jgi:hypothetical protein